jgi:micrococcal nuclease
LKSFIKLFFKIIFTAAALIMLAYFAWKYAIPRLDQRESREKEKTERVHRDTALVKKVFDGDTFEAEINGRTEKIRLLGIDTPERFDSEKFDRDMERTAKDKKTVQKLGELSYQHTLRLIGGKKVLLEADPQGDNKDKYNRLLRYVWLDDGTLVNLKIIQEGYANAYRRFNLTRQKEFIEAENKAMQNKKGLWGDTEGSDYLRGRDK